MARGAYDTTIKDEIRRHGAQGVRSSRIDDLSQEDRDKAVRNMNIRRDVRGGRNPHTRYSTAYTPEEAPRKAKGKGGGGDRDRKNKPDKKKTPRRPVTTPDDKPVPITPYAGDPAIGFPWAPGYTPPGDTMPFNGPPDPNNPGGGGPGGGPVVPPVMPGGDQIGVEGPVSPEFNTPDLLPLLAAAGITSAGGRGMMRKYPSMDEVDTAIRAQPHIGGVPVPYDYAEGQVIPDARGLPAPDQPATPRQRMMPLPTDVQQLPPPSRALPPPSAPRPPLTIEHRPSETVPMDIPVGDKEKAPVKKPRIKTKTKMKTKMRL